MKISFENFHLYKSEKKSKDEELLHISALQFENGRINVIKSASGLGKTQLLNAICGQSNAFDGTLLLNDQMPRYDKSFFKTECSYVTSDDCYLADLSIKEQFSIVSNDQSRIDELVHKFKLTPILNQKISLCSSGEKKRVEVATALLKNLPILLLDEPTANLDQNNTILIFGALKDFARTHLVIIASHEDDVVLDDCNIYEIQKKEIVPISIFPQEECSTDNSHSNDIVPKQINPKVSLKFGLSKSFKNKLSFIFGFVFCFLLFCSTFFCSSLSTINQNKCLSDAIDTLPSDYTQIIYSNEYVSESNEVFSCTQATISSSYGSLINVACLEDLGGDLRRQCQGIFDSYKINNQSTDQSFFHPIILTKNQQSF